MDQRVKGGSPPKASVDATSAPKGSEKDHVPEKKRKAGAEEESGDKGAVLELLIEGRCGTKGDQQLQISGKDTSCPEGNVRLRIGLQAKRTKKPPKILESYVCKPTIRTYQRQGRGALRGEAEGGVGHQSKTSSSADEATSKEQHSGLDSVQTTSKQTASAPPVAPSSLSTSSSTTTTTSLQPLPSAPTTASASAASAQRSKSTSQVPIKLAEKADVVSNGTSEKVKKSSLVNGLSAAHKSSSPKTDSKSQIPSPKSSQTEEIKTETSTGKKHNGLVQASKHKGLSNEKGTVNISNASSEKVKSGKHNTTPSISSTAKLTADSSQKEPSNNSKSPSISTVTPSSPITSQPQDDPLMQPMVEKRKDKKKKSKKEKRKDRKSKRDRLEGERAKSRSEESKTKKERGREDRHKSNDVKKEQAPSKNDKTSSQECQVENTESNADIGSCTIEEVICDTRQDDNSIDIKGREADPVETTGDNSKSKDQDTLRNSPPVQSISTPPASLPPLSAPSSPPEQDSRPLKKRKARRPSWTKLVHRAQKAENHEATLDSQRNPSLSFPQNPKTSLNPNESHAATSSTVPKSSSPPSTLTRSPSPKQTNPEPVTCATKTPPTPTRKRGRPKSQSGSSNEPPPKLSPNVTPTQVPIPGQDRPPTPVQLCPTESRPSPRKRGRPPKRPLQNDDQHSSNALSDHGDKKRSVPMYENRQLNIRRLINEMKKRKKKRFHKVMSSVFVAKDAKSIEATTVQTLSSLSSSLGGKFGPQINVSKRGTIYMGKRRGRKPKVQSGISHSSPQPSLFTSAPETSLFSQPPPSHPFPSPSLTHSSGAQSPYSEHSFADPSPCLLFSQPFSLPSPSSSCTSPRPPSSSSLSSFVRKSCPCQGRPHFPFHQSTCKLSTPTTSLQHAPGSPPGHLKEATTSPRSESHSEETLPSDSGIGTDNNSICERGEMRGSRGMLRVGHSSGIVLSSQKHPASILEHPSAVSPPLLSRHPNPNAHRDRHRHRRRDFDCSSSCSCLCACSGQSKCIQSDFYSCHNALKRQKGKHKKKHQQMQMQDPEFLSELEDLIVLFSEMHIGRRSWARAGLVHGFEGGSPGGRRHHSSHSMRSNIFRINLNGFYSPHPSTYPHNPSFPTQPFYSCHPVHCNRKLDRRQCGCSSKFQDSIENMYRSYPSLYNHLPNSYPLPSASQFALHQSPHFLLNPARFHRRRNRLLRDGGIGGEESPRGSGHAGSGLPSNFSCGCGRSEHKHKHKHRHRHCDEEDELQEDEVERERFGSKQRSGFIFRPEEIGRKTARGLGSMLSKESPWSRQNGSDCFSSVAASSSTERFKQIPLTSVGLGSTHLSSFGGGWGALGHSWTKYSSLGGTTFGSWTGFNSEKQQTNKTVAAGVEDDDDDEEEEEEDEEESESVYRTSPAPVHTNLFTTAAMETGTRGLRWGGDKPWRRDEPAWMEMRETGSHRDSRNWGSQKTVPSSDNGSVHKRRPGRPRKHPLPSEASPPAHSTTSGFKSVPEVQAGTEAARRERTEPGLLTEAQLQAKKKKSRQRRHSPSPPHQSVTEDRAESESPSESSGHSDVEQAPSEPVPVPTEERTDTAPSKSFLKAGLYSDDYKTTDPPSQNTHFDAESTDYSPEERDYSLLPAPIHVGKYLRLKRIHFQLPYDVMWLWQHDQLCRPPVVPLKRKRRYCRPKEKTVPSQGNEDQTEDITSLFPHLDMDPLSSCERSFVVQHHVFLLRNWELVRERQIRLRIERERQRDSEEEEEEEEERTQDHSHIKSTEGGGEKFQQ
ncbi:histone-lysine N-methyltransferase ASH1L isoform X2 [Boleophthalmus pectinirostris]|uniref:histone-lysine N-methyltransferase ASH1L isoform X2 n=1 Tax=Boleophthalmus pectinirostris TaxID=150288 RepID=UPI00242EA71D|nr:histone-lysine N-methyltransferase ASH1L isoform X2 [Boleophthalmus pectinirostris]